MLGEHDDALATLLAGTDAARVACLAGGETAGPLARLERLAARARELSFVQQELAADLSRAACQARAGQPGAARQLLERAVREARGAGLVALAAEADEQRARLSRP